jgi:CRISPR-associated protein (TIGR02710 family)
VSGLGQLKERLEQASNRWQSLPLDTREEQAIAMEFYSKEVFPLSKQVFIATEAPRIKEPIYGLILPVGTSPEPLILSISAIKPERVLFLYTKKTEPMLDTIVEHTGLRPSQWEKRPVDPADLAQIYREIKDAWNRWGKRRGIAVDVTGGTKAMASGAAMAGTLVGAQLIYIANRKYLPDPYRRPEPGSEYIEFVPNPYDVFGDLDEKEAMNRFRRHDFAGAALILENLAKKAAYPRRYEALANLSAAYKAWDDMNFPEASICLRKTIDIVEMLLAHDGTVLGYGLADKIQPLRVQLEGLERVRDLMPSKPGEPPLPVLEDCNATASLIFTICASAERKAARGEYDTASLLPYIRCSMLHLQHLPAPPQYVSWLLRIISPRFYETGAMPSATFSAPHTPLSNTYAEQAPPPFSTKVARILSGRSPGYQIIACARLPFMRAKVTSASLPCARLPDYSGGTAGFAGRLKAAPCCLFPILPTWGHLTGFAIFSLPALEAQT